MVILEGRKMNSNTPQSDHKKTQNKIDEYLDKYDAKKSKSMSSSELDTPKSDS